MTDKSSDNSTNNPDDQPESDLEKRRANLRRLLVSGGVIGSSAAIPDQWSKAVVQSVILPAHAQSSGITFGNFNGQGPIP